MNHLSKDQKITGERSQTDNLYKGIGYKRVTFIPPHWESNRYKLEICFFLSMQLASLEERKFSVPTKQGDMEPSHTREDC